MRGVVIAAVWAVGCSRGSASGAAPATATASASATASAAATTDASASITADAAVMATACKESLDARTAKARVDYGADVRLQTVDGALLFIDADRGRLFPETVDFATRALAALRHDRIGVRPLCPVSVYVFASNLHFLQRCAHSGYLPEGKEVGVYSEILGEVAVDLSGGRDYVPTIAHEIAHVAMDADVDAKAPLWYRECVASQYEWPVLKGDEIRGADDWRYKQLRDAVAAGNREAHLGTLFGMSDEDFRAKVDGGGVDGQRWLLHLGMARSVCQWLDAQGQLWPLYRSWRDDFANDPDGVATFTRITGHAPTDADADSAWHAWVMRTK
jgi:hypothetical protein